MDKKLDLMFQKALKRSLPGPSFEKIMETKDVIEALEYLRRRQSTIRCIELIEMIEGVLTEEK